LQIFTAFFICFLFLGCEPIEESAKDIFRQVQEATVAEQIEQYHFAKRNGAVKEACDLATVITRFYLKAKNDDEYSEWDIRRTLDCEQSKREYMHEAKSLIHSFGL
jgi:hypothetical protein